MTSRSYSIASLLFWSGLCALVYQVTWLRELRLTFGASTPASAAVLAVFMGGLGFGSLWLGGRAERAARPLRFYGHLEIGIALCAAATPLLLTLTRAAYVALGGSVALGWLGGTAVRLVASALVLLPPTLLMGGTLPAAARAATIGFDAGRRSTALLYGANTLGAVTGAAATTFVLLEVFGTRLTLWLGCLVNVLVGLVARVLDRGFEASDRSTAPAARPEPRAAPARQASGERRRFVLLAAATTGFVFLELELVWYRMLAPLLGGSSYTFGLILAVALFGIGVGGLAYARVAADRPAKLGAFAASCGLEALGVALPFALGDRIAWLAMCLRPMGSVGLWGHALAWTVVTGIVVLPAALVAGYQFPLLIALLGTGRAELGRQVGLAYAFNTAGAIAGSLCGGFLLLPVAGALGLWQLAVSALVVVGIGAAVLHVQAAGGLRAALGAALGAAGVSVLALLAVHATTGPTALWRHVPVGAGRADEVTQGATRVSLKRYANEQNRAISWQADGRESAVALHTLNDASFFVNGKSDGAAVTDAGTQVMAGLLGALVHPAEVRSVLVIGLGTGSTAGWFGALPGVERVDVVELEPAILHVARVCAPVNRRVLDNPKVHIHIGDAREVLLTTPHKYDLIFSEPSNPYRAGIASLFTREFYESVRERLEPGGALVQWVQAYEIDAQSVRTVYATLGSVFPSVESWRSKDTDLVLLGRLAEVPLDFGTLSRRVAAPPFADALLQAWRVADAEGVLAHFVARAALARAIAEQEGELGVNTDDRNLLEFSLARALGRPHDFRIDALLLLAHQRGEGRPVLAEGSKQRVDWATVYDNQIGLAFPEGGPIAAPPQATLSPEMQARLEAEKAWLEDRPAAVISHWEAQPKPPTNPVEVTVMADAYAVRAMPDKARPLIEKLRGWLPIEADAIAARLAWGQGEPRAAWDSLRRALIGYRTDPWANNTLMSRALALAPAIAQAYPHLYADIQATLRQPFAVYQLRYQREGILFDMAMDQKSRDCVAALDTIGPYVPWSEGFLSQRLACYELALDARAERARLDLEELRADSAQDFGAGITPAEPPPKRKVAEP